MFVLALLCASLALAGERAADRPSTRHGAGVAAQPVTHDDAVLGRLVRDSNRLVSRYVGNASFGGVLVDVLVAPASDDGLDDALATAHALWPDADDWDARARRVAADQLLPTYFEAHGGPDAARLGSEDFVARMQPAGVSLFEDGEFELWYDDGGLFEGRAIRVAGSLRDGPQAADLRD